MDRIAWLETLLISAGIVLAIALFGAGAFWKGKSTPERSSQLMFKKSRTILQQFRPVSGQLGNKS